jgi:hypothetical protein
MTHVLTTLHQHSQVISWKSSSNVFYFPGVNYKNLMEAGDPLQTLRPYLLSANVHVFAKMASKLRGKVCELRFYCLL